MPIILGLAEQQQAFKDIGAAVKKVEKINQFLSEEVLTGDYSISLYVNTDEEGKRKRISASILQSDREMVNELVENYKRNLIAHVRDLAQKHNIGLDDKEKAVLGL